MSENWRVRFTCASKDVDEVDYYAHLVAEEHDKAGALKRFYEEYFAVADLPAEFYLETVREVFQEYALARGTLRFRGRLVDPATIRRTIWSCTSNSSPTGTSDVSLHSAAPVNPSTRWTEIRSELAECRALPVIT